MEITIPIRPWKGDSPAPIDDCGIFLVSDYAVETEVMDAGFEHMHTVWLGETEVHCQGFALEVGTDDVFMLFEAKNVSKESFQRFMDDHGDDDWMPGTGRVYFGTEDNNKKTCRWFPGASIVIPVSGLEMKVSEPWNVIS